MADTCENYITIMGKQQDLLALQTWFQSQSHDQAPDTTWAALYHLEQEAKKLAAIPGVYEGAPDHGYGIATFKVIRYESSENGEIRLNFSSKRDPCMSLVQVLAERHPNLKFACEFTNLDSGECGGASFVDGKLESIEIEEGEDSFFASEEDSAW